MEAFLLSTGLVAIAEIGDKTQLLTMLLVARFRHPWVVLAGVLAATIANHLVASAVGAVVGDVFSGHWMKILLGVGFIAFAVWSLIPDKVDEEDAPKLGKGGVFVTTVIAFFLAEMGDKTQVATVALAARFHTVLLVAAGTTAGMMLANAPAAFLSHKFAERIPLHLVRWFGAACYGALGLWTLWQG